MTIEEILVAECKVHVSEGDLDGLRNKWEEYQDTDFEKDIAWDYVFQRVYLHAALKKKWAICEWMDVIFEEFNPIIKIAMRPMFSYARYLLNKVRGPSLP